MEYLRRPGEGGPGFCYESDPDLFRGATSLVDGPLLIGLDSNIIYDFEAHGLQILEQTETEGIDELRRRELDALGELINLWLVRDIRFIVVPRIRGDFRKLPSPSRQVERERLLRRIEQALTFQLDDWGREAERFGGDRPLPPGTERALAKVSSLDALMLRSAWNSGVDVFLTRDHKVHTIEASLPAPFPMILSPSQLVSRIHKMRGDLFSLGQIAHDGCTWRDSFPMGDTGKWVPLLEALGLGIERSTSLPAVERRRRQGQ